MAAVDHALIHRARIVGKVRAAGGRNDQGEYPTEPFEGPWFRCRRMTKRQRDDSPDTPGGRRRSEVGYSLMWGTDHEDGSPIVAPTDSNRVEVDTLRGQPDDGAVWEITAPPLVFDTGGYVFGGQAEIVRVEDAA